MKTVATEKDRGTTPVEIYLLVQEARLVLQYARSQKEVRDCDLWDMYSGYSIEEMLSEDSCMQAYMTDGMVVHMCGSTFNERSDNPKDVCDCPVCSEFKRIGVLYRNAMRINHEEMEGKK